MVGFIIDLFFLLHVQVINKLSFH